MGDVDRIRKTLEQFSAQGGAAAQLVIQKRFVCWKRMPKKSGKGYTKPPIDPITGKRCDGRNPANFLTAHDALQHMAAGRCDGIGIVTGMIGGLPLCGIDIDHCIADDGSYSTERAADVRKVIKSGYCELSPSGTGIHGLAICRKPQGDRYRSQEVEIYDNKQYLTLTGNRRPDMTQSLSNNPDAVNYLFEKYLHPREQQPEYPPVRDSVQTVAFAARLRTAEEHDHTFSELWNGTRPHNDESANDIALMNKLAYWLDGNENAMVDAFCVSPHAASKDADHQSKMQRKDYLKRTATKASQDCKRTAGEDDMEYQAQRTAPTMQEPSSEKDAPPSLCCFSDVAYEPPVWLIKPYIQSGKLTIMQGDPGSGKTAAACAIAAEVSRGGFVLNDKAEQGNVLILSVEDDPSTLRGRIEASGGLLKNCFFPPDGAVRSFNDPLIETFIKQCQAKLIIFDPLQAFLGAKVDMFRANETRPVLADLAAMAKRNECAVVIVSHLNKSQNKAMYRALGSMDIIAAARGVLHVGRNPKDTSQRVIVQIKCSSAEDGQSILYSIGDRGGVTWIGYTDITYEDLETQAAREEKGVEYDNEPLVQVYRQYLTDNPGGGFVSYADLKSTGMELLGFAPFGNARDLCSKMNKKFTNELMRRDGIMVTTGAASHGRRGARIEQYVVPDAYQQKLGDA